MARYSTDACYPLNRLILRVHRYMLRPLPSIRLEGATGQLKHQVTLNPDYCFVFCESNLRKGNFARVLMKTWSNFQFQEGGLSE